MKKDLVFLIVSVLAFSFLGLAEAEEVLQINEAGKVESIEISETFRSLTESEMKAFSNPGQEVPIGSGVVTDQKKDFWYVVPITTYNQVVVFSEGTIQTIAKDMKVSGKPTFVIYVVFFLVSIGCMLMSNTFKWRGNSSNNTAFAAVFAFVAFIATAFATAIVVAAFAVVVAVAAVFAFAAVVAVAVAIDNNNTKVYWISSLVFYICAAVAIFI